MAKASKKAAPKTRIVEGAGVIVVSPDANRAAEVEKAMSDAITQALADGISDPEKQRERMMAARDKVLKG